MSQPKYAIFKSNKGMFCLKSESGNNSLMANVAATIEAATTYDASDPNDLMQVDGFQMGDGDVTMVGYGGR